MIPYNEPIAADLQNDKPLRELVLDVFAAIESILPEDAEPEHIEGVAFAGAMLDDHSLTLDECGVEDGGKLSVAVDESAIEKKRQFVRNLDAKLVELRVAHQMWPPTEASSSTRTPRFKVYTASSTAEDFE